MTHRLIKKLNINGKDCYVCSLHGTETCRQLHKETQSDDVVCSECPMMAKILEKLYIYEEIEHEEVWKGADNEER